MDENRHITKEKRAELLLDHHKDTYHYIDDQQKRRNRLFVFLLLLLALMTLDTFSPQLLPEITNAYVRKTLGKDGEPLPQFDFSVIGSAAWFLLLSLTIQYFQRSILIDRKFNYIDRLEQQICREIGGSFITREGSAYYSETGVSTGERTDLRPLFLRAVGPLYTYIFPLILTALIVIKLARENFEFHSGADYFNLIIGLCIILYSFFYLVWVSFRK